MEAATPAPVNAAAQSATPRSLIGLSLAELEAELATLDVERFRARQLWHWIYHRGAKRFQDMTTLAKPFRALLEERFSVARPEIERAQESADGTRKWLLKLADGNLIETVHIP